VIAHRSGDLEILEIRTVLPTFAWVSSFQIVTGAKKVSAHVWTLQERNPDGPGAPWRSAENFELNDEALAFRVDTRWPKDIEPDRSATEAEDVRAGHEMMPPLPVYLSLGANGPRLSHTVNLAEKHDDSPRYETSVLPEKLVNGRLKGDWQASGYGLVHGVQQYEVSSDRPLIVACGAGLDAAGAERARRSSLEDPVAESENAWHAYFDSVPQFRSENKHLEQAYWYRWYGLRLNTVDVTGLPNLATGGLFAPYVTEGIGFFRNYITYSAQAHLREMSWHHDPSVAVGILENFSALQKAHGLVPGHNYSARPARDFYHADFATGAALLDQIHPGSVTNQHLQGLGDYYRAFRKQREIIARSEDGCFGETEAASGVYMIFDQNETGQEYMNRYQFVLDSADDWGAFKLAGADATAYMAALENLLEQRGVEHREPSQRRAALGELWNDEAGMFLDRKPEGWSESGGGWSPARPSTGLYPLMLNPLPVPNEKASRAIKSWLLDEERFNLPAGFPAEARTEPTFDAEGRWKSRRMNCPWSGRSWPMANSHLVDAAANVARLADPELRHAAGSALLKAVSMLFHDGDPNRPCCYEHYNPLTGKPALYRGYDDYMHSWVVDLIMRHAVGVQPQIGEWHVDPLPLGAESECSEIPHPRGRLHVKVSRDGTATTDLTVR
jgi:hypothetical protein